MSRELPSLQDSIGSDEPCCASEWSITKVHNKFDYQEKEIEILLKLVSDLYRKLIQEIPTSEAKLSEINHNIEVRNVFDFIWERVIANTNKISTACSEVRLILWQL